MPPKKKKNTTIKKYDREFENIKQTLSSKARKKRTEDEPQTVEMYVDSNRLAAVNMGSDLKSEMNTSRFAGAFSKDRKIGDPNDKFYIMQAEHMIKSGNSAMALHFVTQALEYNRENRDALVLLAKCHLLRLDWDSALETADMALNFNKKDVRAMLVKGEALFNICQFEHAIVFFVRAQGLSREREVVESCKFGVQKCRQIILDNIPAHGEMFQFDGVEAYFKKLRKNAEKETGLLFDPMQEAETMFSVTELVGLGHVRKRLIQNVRDRKKIREEEELEKRNVKTLIDREYAEMERQKIREKKIAKSGSEAGVKVNTLAMAAAKATKTQAVTKAVLTTHAEAKKAKMKKSGGSRNKERLRSDIVYLHSLANKIERRTDIDEDKVQALVSREANAALSMLKEREEFWKLVDNSSSVPPPTT